MKRKCKVVCLPTNQKATDVPFTVGITKCNDGKLRIGNPIGKSESRQHLYFISYEVITLSSDNSGWFLRVHSMSGFADVITLPSFTSKYKYYKIIASTDTFLGLPTPSKDFIQKYCEVGGIDEVMVEYTCEKDHWKERSTLDTIIVYSKEETEKYNIIFDFYPSKPKVNKDNEISISKVKDTWTREEVTATLLNFATQFISPLENAKVVQWIKEKF